MDVLFSKFTKSALYESEVTGIVRAFAFPPADERAEIEMVKYQTNCSYVEARVSYYKHNKDLCDAILNLVPATNDEI